MSKKICVVFLISFINLNEIILSEQCITFVVNSTRHDGSTFAENLTTTTMLKTVTTIKQSNTTIDEITFSTSSLTATPNGIRLTNDLVEKYTFKNYFSGSNMDIGSVEVNAFKNKSYLISIDLSINKLRYIIRGTFDSLNSLRYLHLQINQFASLSDMAINNIPSVEYLYLGSNKLTEFYLSELDNSSNLTELYLYNCQMTFVNLTSAHQKIDRINIENNKITRIETDGTNLKNSLKILWATENQIKSYSWLVNMLSLDKLFIDASSHQYLLPSHFKESKRMSTIKFFNTDDYIFQNFCLFLNNLPNLTDIYFYNSFTIVNISSEAFNCDNKLTSLTLSSSKITTVPNGFISRFKKLNYLYLWSNKLNHLDSNVFQGANYLKEIQLWDNNLSSTYKNESFYNFTGFAKIPKFYF